MLQLKFLVNVVSMSIANTKALKAIVNNAMPKPTFVSVCFCDQSVRKYRLT